MPRGQGRGRRQGRGRGRQRRFFLESCLLVLLHRGPGYGYGLMDELQEFGFDADEMDISLIYRALRKLQEEGLVNDSWDENSKGPQRRMYTISDLGENILTEWMEGLRERREEIEALEAAYAKVKKE